MSEIVEQIINRKSKQQATLEIPQIALPQSDNVPINLNETFQVDATSGQLFISIPLPMSPNRNGFTPKLSLSYGNGLTDNLFGRAWNLNLPVIQCDTKHKLSKYFYTDDCSNAENREELLLLEDFEQDDYKISSYGPRTEQHFSRIERIFHPNHGTYWRVTSKENRTTFYGFSPTCRITDANDASKVQWLPEFAFDDKGSWIWYEYKTENLKRIKYGNWTPYYIAETKPYSPELPINAPYFFELRLHCSEGDTFIPTVSEHQVPFSLRPFCKRLLMYHHFPNLNEGMPTLVWSFDLDYQFFKEQSGICLTGITKKGYIWDHGTYSQKALPKMTFNYDGLNWEHENQKVDDSFNKPFESSNSKSNWIGLTATLLETQDSQVTDYPLFMRAYENGLGKKTVIEYEKWNSLNRIGVSKTIVTDAVMNTCFTSEYKYHHGYYDELEQTFCGFGMVERLDTERFDNLYQTGTLTKTWFHTSAFFNNEPLFTSLKKEYWEAAFKQKFKQSLIHEYSLPELIILNINDLRDNHALYSDVATWRDALRACKGKIFRREMFSLDVENEAYQVQYVPDWVDTYYYEIQYLKSPNVFEQSIFHVLERETLTCTYERVPTDPCVVHKMTLDSDEWGNILESVTIAYPRLQTDSLLEEAINDSEIIRNAKQFARNAQQKVFITCTNNDFTNDIITPSCYTLRKIWQSKTFELTGIVFTGSLFKMSDLKNKINDFQWIEYNEKLIYDFQKRLVAHTKTLFYDAELNAPLPNGQMSYRSISFQTYQLAYTQSLIDAIFQPSAFSLPFEVTEADMLASQFMKDGSNWWMPLGMAHYYGAKKTFFMPVAYSDALGCKTTVFYDDLHFYIQKIIDAIGNETEVLKFNYRTLSADIVKDINDNISSIVLDELGLVKTILGASKSNCNVLSREEYTDKIENQRIIHFFKVAKVENCNWDLLQQQAHVLLGKASKRQIYDFSTIPITVVTIVREQQVEPNLESRLQITFKSLNGSGHEVLTKVQAGASRWISKERVILNHESKVIKQFASYFSMSPTYEKDAEWLKTAIGSIFYYDRLGRCVQTVLPNGTFAATHFKTWKQIHFDTNDTVQESEWYRKRMLLTVHHPEKRAALKTVIHCNTPTYVIMDGLGRPVLNIESNRWQTDKEVRETILYYTYFDWNAEGNIRSITDARGNKVMILQYDMLGYRVAQTSMDAGNRWMLNNALGHPVKTWDERKHEFSYQYDALHRPTKKYIKGGDGLTSLNHCYEWIEYGEGFRDDKNRNLRGKIAILYDTAGKVVSEKYDFQGNLLAETRILVKDYKNTPHWDILNPDILLEGATYTFRTNYEYDALNRKVKQTTSDGKTLFQAFNQAGWLTQLTCQQDGLSTNYIQSIDYDANGQRTKIKYGNGAITQYEYDQWTFKLRRLKTITIHGLVQDLTYTYDPIGNIIEILDGLNVSSYDNDNQVIINSNKYVYDSLYRLIEATGVEQIQMEPNFMAMRPYTERYCFDAVGNMVQMSHETDVMASWTRNYAYETNCNRLKTTAINGKVDAYLHHAQHGFIERMPHLQQMSWSFKETLQSTVCQTDSLDSIETTYYVYDGVGQRVRKITEVLDLNCNSLIIKSERIYLNSDKIYQAAQSVTAFEMESCLEHAETVSYQLGNHLGSISLELDENQLVINQESYHPYGTTAYQTHREATKKVVKRHRYTGMERDEETGLSYHSARYYMPWLGRWCSADPIGVQAGLGLYTYVKHNPIAFRDSTGMYEEAGHYYTVYFVSLAVGFSPEIAFKNAFYAQMPDEVNELEAIQIMKPYLYAVARRGSVIASRIGLGPASDYYDEVVEIANNNLLLVQRGLHALTGGNAEDERRRTGAAFSLLTPGSMEMGFLLHRFGDTFGHTGMWKEDYLYGTFLGHGYHIQEPDQIHERPELYKEYVTRLYFYLTISSLERPDLVGGCTFSTLTSLFHIAHRKARLNMHEIHEFCDKVGAVRGYRFVSSRVGMFNVQDDDQTHLAQIALIRQLSIDMMQIKMREDYRPELEDPMSLHDFQKKYKSSNFPNTDNAEHIANEVGDPFT